MADVRVKCGEQCQQIHCDYHYPGVLHGASTVSGQGVIVCTVVLSTCGIFLVLYTVLSKVIVIEWVSYTLRRVAKLVYSLSFLCSYPSGTSSVSEMTSSRTTCSPKTSSRATTDKKETSSRITATLIPPTQVLKVNKLLQTDIKSIIPSLVFECYFISLKP